MRISHALEMSEKDEFTREREKTRIWYDWGTSMQPEASIYKISLANLMTSDA